MFLNDLEGAAPPLLHSSYIQKPRTIRVNFTKFICIEMWNMHRQYASYLIGILISAFTIYYDMIIQFLIFLLFW